jgi:hypothetical protein
MAPGGAWWVYVQKWIAERDNDTAKLAELKPFLDELKKTWTQKNYLIRLTPKGLKAARKLGNPSGKPG